MRPTRLGADRYWGLAALLLITAVSAAVATSCGGGGGSSNGGLCEQCGASPDGPCQESVLIDPGPEVPICDDASQVPPCTVTLACFRKLGSAQRRCFPKYDEQFRCDGARANRSTPGPTPTPTVTPAPTSTAAPVCGNGTVEGDEQCDGADLDDQTCDSRCDNGSGVLTCIACAFDFTGCIAAGSTNCE